MPKQTAVEWLIEQLEEKGDMRETPSIRNLQLNINTSDYLLLKRQALAMEKEQIVKAFEVGYNQNYEQQYDTIEQYYNETYKGGQL
jgi:hypothetical protein